MRGQMCVRAYMYFYVRYVYVIYIDHLALGLRGHDTEYKRNFG